MSADTPNATPVSETLPEEFEIEVPSTGQTTATIPLMEEEVSVSKREVVTGKVRVRTVVSTREELVCQELDTEQVVVTRWPVNAYVDVAPSIRTEGDVTIVPVLEEVVVLEIKLLLKEEVHIRRTNVKETVQQSVTLRKQQALVEQIDASDNR